MRKTLLVLAAAAGALVGAAVMHAVDRPAPRIPTLTPGPTADTGGPARDTTAPTGAGSSTTAERADLYRITAAADSQTLVTMIREAAQQPAGPARQFALQVLLTRYAELDPAAAVEAAADLPVELRAPLYAAWAVKDPAAALDALAKIADHATARAIAAALVPALGGDERALRQVAAAVPFGVESAVYADAITARAAIAPDDALAQALALTDLGARSQALEGIAQNWAKLDPVAALTAAGDITDPSLRQSFLASVARTWARLDTDAALAYLTSLDSSAQPGLFNTLGGQLAQLRPREILTLGDSSSTPASFSLQMAAIQALASQDPDLALRTAEALPAGPQRDNVLGLVARAYGARDPDAALAWARGSGEQSRTLMVLQGIAQRDVARAMDLALTLEPPTLRMQAVQSVVIAGGFRAPGTASALADRIVTLPDTALRSNTLRQLLTVWSSTAPDAALDWLTTHDLDIQGTYLQVGQQLARNSPARAAELTARIPAAARGEWIQGVAEGYAQSDPQGAVAWLAQYRGDPAYSGAVGAVAASLARTDPAAAARLLDTASDSGAGAARAGVPVATLYAQRDPQAAASWAKDYDAGLNQMLAVPAAVGAWAQSDATSARAWTLQLPSGQSRDAALTALLTATSTTNVDTTLLDAFSSDAARNQAVVNTAMRLNTRDRAAAARLIDTYVTDESLREQAKRNLERISPRVLFNPNGVPVF
jgi:hypothetical protein